MKYALIPESIKINSSFILHLGGMLCSSFGLEKIYHFTTTCSIMEGLKYDSNSRNRGVCSERTKGSFPVEMMEEVMLVDGLARTANALISEWRIYGGRVMTVCSLPV